MKGPKASAELIAAVRRLAAEGKSQQEIAEELSSSVHQLTRSAVAGIGGRNGIKFNGKDGIRRYQAPAKVRRPLRIKTVHVKPQEDVQDAIVIKKLVTVKQVTKCCWGGCIEYASEGGMFCHTHGRRPLFG